MSFHNTTNPTGGVNMEHVMEEPDPNESLLERILSSHNMHTARNQVEQNKGSPGIDKMTVADFPSFARKNWNSIRESIKTGSYTPMPVKRVEIPKVTGGVRLLGIPTMTSYCTSYNRVSEYLGAKSEKTNL